MRGPSGHHLHEPAQSISPLKLQSSEPSFDFRATSMRLRAGRPSVSSNIDASFSTLLFFSCRCHTYSIFPLTGVKTMINRLISSKSLRPLLQRTATKVAQKTVQPAVVISSSRGRPFSSTGFEETANNGNARSLDDYEQIMGPAPAMSWIEEAVHATAASGVCSLTGWSSSSLTLAETTSTTMGLENVFEDDDLAATAGYRTQCSFESDAEDRDCVRPGVDSPANEV